MARNCLIQQKKFSIKWRASYSALSYGLGCLRLRFGGITAVFPAASRGSITRSSASYALSARSIPRSGQNSKILGRDDTEVIRYLITIGVPFSGHLLAQEGQDRGFEVGECCMTSIVGDMPVHQAP